MYIYIHTWILCTIPFSVYKQQMNQFSNSQRYITIAGYDELRRTFVSNTLSLNTAFCLLTPSTVYLR